MAEPTTFPLPPILQHADPTPTLITQGAEGRLYKTTYLVPSRPAALKYRPSKPYRHPILDARLTRTRILAEARVLHKCRRDGVLVPAVLALDDTAGWLMLEWIAGPPVRVAVNNWLDRRHPAGRAPASSAAALGAVPKEEEEQQQQEAVKLQTEDGRPSAEAERRLREDRDLKALMRKVGAAVGRLHKSGVIHGDLTTSNMMLRPPLQPMTATAAAGAGAGAGTGPEAGEDSALEGDVVLIDFGLAYQNSMDEDRAVDLYVLERAYGSTHPRAESLFPELLEGYKEALPAKQSTLVLRKLEDVRMRGRKRSMVG
ncbi:EKC/KEOPS complex subunit BUD32 like protein [Verticillium longisporum]|uniref:EKC/KEOPS complex subunit BUD32 n=1 Tax=Verticillium longisporum TaxID=100787 RepID=A0A8I2ZRW5_VERLO|nr:EKC/KEOPS complex subunit BUD32 like protein [Verticillium longisporum]